MHGSNSVVLITVGLLILLCCAHQIGSDRKHATWLSIAMSPGSSFALRPAALCGNFTGFNKRQKAICRKNTESMDIIRQGAQTAIGECQYQFRFSRWNCPLVDNETVFGQLSHTNLRESAFIHAIASAGVAHAITKACSAGSLSTCRCDQSTASIEERSRAAPPTKRSTAPVEISPPDFKWYGCSDNIGYGVAFSRNFIESQENVRSEAKIWRAVFHQHNANAGRKNLEASYSVQCKCHGVSGSCDIKTCWRTLNHFRKIGDIIKDRYDGATKVRHHRTGSRRTLVPYSANLKLQTERDLVYGRDSPEFCKPDARLLFPGTQGRACNRTSKGAEGCEVMCCGRGYLTRTVRIQERCNCKFQYCCYVKCDTCVRQADEYICK